MHLAEVTDTYLLSWAQIIVNFTQNHPTHQAPLIFPRLVMTACMDGATLVSWHRDGDAAYGGSVDTLFMQETLW